MGLLGKLWVKLGLDSSGLKKGISDADKATTSFKDRLKTLGQAVGVAFGIGAIVQFGRKVIQTRGEFESLEISFRTLLKSKSAADQLMAQMVDLAARTPFSLQEVATGAKQLLAYGFAASEVRGTLSRLGDVAAGLGLPMERLTYLYGTTRTQGRLFARDLMQFTTSGVPLLDELAKMFGKSTEEINKMVSAGDIGFEEVKQAFGNMTGEAGKFYNLMEERSKGISGKISNLGDAISVMFNNIGKSQEGAINSALDGAKFLVDNYQSVLDILKALIATYGVYKATSIVSNSIHKISDRVTYEAEMSALQKLIPVKRASKNADIEEAVAKGRLSQSSAERIITIRAEAAAELDRLKVIEKSLVSKVAVAAGENAIALQQALNAERRERAAREELSQAMLSGDAQKIRRAEIKLTLAEEELNIALKNKEVAANALATTSTKAKSAATAVDTAQTKINTAATNTGSTAKNLMTAATMRLTKAFHSLKLAFASNPFGIILTGITLAISAFSIFSKETDKANDSYSAFSLQMQQEKSTLADLKKALSETAYGSKERADIINLINQRYKDYLPSLLTEKDSIDKITSALTKANEKLTENLRLKLKASRLEEIQSTQLGVETNFVSTFTGAYKKTDDKTPEQIALFANSLAQLTERAREGGASVDDARKVLIALGHDAERVNGAIISSDGPISKQLRNVISWFNSIKDAAGEASTQTAVLNALVADLGDKTVDKEKEIAETYRTRAEILADIKARITEISALEAKPKKTSSEIKNLEALREELKTYENEYKTFTGKEFGAKVKVETDKDQLKNAASGSIAFLENEISKRQLAIKLTTNDADIKTLQKEIAGFEATIKAKLEVETPKSERQTIEDEIKGFRDEQLAIPLSIDTVEAQKQFDVLQKKIDERQEKLDKAPKDYAIGSETDLSNKIADQEKLLKNSKLTEEQYAKIKDEITRLKGEMDALPQNVFPVGSLDWFNKEIATATEKLGSLEGAELAAAQAAIALLNAQKQGAELGYSTELERLTMQLSTYESQTEATTGKVREYWEALANDTRAAIASLGDNLIEWGDLIKSGISDSMRGLGDAIGSGNLDEALQQGILSPMASMLGQLGEQLIAMGIAKLSLDAWAVPFSGPGMIAAGAALVVLSQVAQSAMAKTVGSMGQSGGNANTFTGGYSNGGSARTAQSLQLASPQSQVVVLETRVSGSDIILSQSREKQRRSR